MVARYSKVFMPLSKVKEKEFPSRPMGCKGIGLLRALQTGRGRDLRASSQSAGRGVYRAQGRRYDYPGRQAHQNAGRNHHPVGPTVWRGWEMTQNQPLSLWFWALSRRRTFPSADGLSWATGFPIEKRYRVGRKRERNRLCRVLSRKVCRFGGTSDLRILGKRNIVSLI